MYSKRITNLVNDLIQQYDLGFPTNIEKLVEAIGAEVRSFGDDSDKLSGFAFHQNGQKIIGINSTESPQRQRFTIAHELGHLFLHRDKKINYDRVMGFMMFRDEHSSNGTDRSEIEANTFAAELLMPSSQIRKDLAHLGSIDLMNPDANNSQKIKTLAKKYRVSDKAMRIRLTALYFS